ncbi:NADP-dependent 3-hydroxy acid dehydrogenase YdfG [Novosphingobium kunmingense]|uniref:NADP-dependent 3-hydroxy acid dehydrogenase YdfG n=1 Tax=Novosphingobium kunmingense TaxID=1211806 RepID=A0A2N0H618_9SPHN|nr:SDR family oxidoreductase [Novosphingobium kunmingense]PKB14385.1 NADP-dependent 3-hydroxy acid dehydrogenase YdfG [Novosphingobium kunmingense]
MSATLSGKGCVVTGAASGIGKALAEQLHAAGARLVLADIDLTRTEAAAAELPGTIALHCDVSDHASVEALAHAAAQQLGQIDLVFANAGTIVNGPLVKSTPEEFDWLMAVNLRGAWSSLTVFARALLEQDQGGRICVTASEHSLGLQHTGAGIYTASKQAVLALADVMRAELPDKVGISVFCPGLVSTGLADAVRPAFVRQPKPHQLEFSRAVQSQGMSAAQAAEAAIAGAVRGDFLIVTHPNSFAAAKRRFAEIEAAFAAQAPVGADADRYDVNRIAADLLAAQERK